MLHGWQGTNRMLETDGTGLLPEHTTAEMHGWLGPIAGTGSGGFFSFQGADCLLCFFTQNKAFEPHNNYITCPAGFDLKLLQTRSRLAQNAPFTLRHRRVWFMWGWVAFTLCWQCTTERNTHQPKTTTAGKMPLTGRTLIAGLGPQPDDTTFGEPAPLAIHHRTLATLGSSFLPRPSTAYPKHDKQRAIA